MSSSLICIPGRYIIHAKSDDINSIMHLYKPLQDLGCSKSSIRGDSDSIL